MSAISDRWIGEPLAAEPEGVELDDAADDELLVLGDAVELEELLLELPHPLAMSAVNASVNNSAFSLMNPLLSCT
jgi:hypothetical protein